MKYIIQFSNGVKKIYQKIKEFRKRGFSLVELLLVIGITGILSSSIVFLGLGYRNRQLLDLTAQQIVSSVRDACSRSRTQQDGLPWGVYFNNTTTDQYTVFSGATYASGASYTRILTTLDSPITFTSPDSGSTTEIRFAQVTCRPNATGAVSITNNLDTVVISVDSNGGVTISGPSVPDQVTGLTAESGDGQITLNWSAPYNGGLTISSYKIYRGLSSESETLLTTATTTSYTNTGLTNNTTYYYKVSAVNSNGEGALSVEASATPSLPSGSLVWATTTNPSSGNDVILSVAVDSSYVYAGGYDSPGNDDEWRIEKRNISSGSLVWATTTNPSSGIDKVNSIAVDSSYVYAGGQDFSLGNMQWRIEKRNISDGSLVWATTTNQSSNADLAFSVARDSSYVYTGGYDEVLGSGNSEWRIEKRNISDGSLVWATTSNPTATDDGVKSIALDSSYIYMGGYASSTTLSAWRIEKRNISDGSLVWATTTNPSSGDDDALSIAVDSSHIYIGGYDQSLGGSNYEWRIEKRSISDGSLTWVATSNPSSVIDFAQAIAVDSSYVYVGGFASSSGSPQWRIEKRSISDGSLVLATTSDPSTSDEVFSIAVDSSYVYTGGYDNSPGNTEWLIIKLVK